MLVMFGTHFVKSGKQDCVGGLVRHGGEWLGDAPPLVAVNAYAPRQPEPPEVEHRASYCLR